MKNPICRVTAFDESGNIVGIAECLRNRRGDLSPRKLKRWYLGPAASYRVEHFPRTPESSYPR